LQQACHVSKVRAISLFGARLDCVADLSDVGSLLFVYHCEEESRAMFQSLLAQYLLRVDWFSAIIWALL